MKRVTFKLFILLFIPVLAFGQTGYDIAKSIDERKEPKDSKNKLTMVLTNKKGKTRSSTLYSIMKNEGEKQIIWFLSPADDKGVAFLKIEHDDKDDEMRLWLPAFKKVRRISASKKGDSFMGSDMSYEDMTTRELDDYTYELKGEETVEGKACYILESTPKPELNSTYSKIVSWVTKDDFSLLKEEFYDKTDDLLKRSKRKVQTIKGYVIPKEIFMENVQKKHSTHLTFDKTDVDVGVTGGLFQEKNLKRLPKK